MALRQRCTASHTNLYGELCNHDTYLYFEHHHQLNHFETIPRPHCRPSALSKVGYRRPPITVAIAITVAVAMASLAGFPAAFPTTVFPDPDSAYKAIRKFAKAALFAIFVRSSKPKRVL